jgi:hypothetical protein
VTSRAARFLAWVMIALVFNVSLGEVCLAGGVPPARPDSSTPSAKQRPIGPPERPMSVGLPPATISRTPVRIVDKDLEQAKKSRRPSSGTPIYKNKRLWAAAGAAILTAAIVVVAGGRGGKEKAAPDLPDFPGPPD